MFMRILIIEDEFNLADAIASKLKKNRYIVDIDTNGNDGLNNALSGFYDLIILDVMLPGINGFDILRELRTSRIDSKIIMLTAKTALDDRLIGFSNGADDYLTKPFYMDELIARVNVLLRRDEVILNDNLLVYDELSLNLKKLNLVNTSNELNVDVIGKEFQILELFLKNPKHIISKETIFNKVWGYDSDSDLNSVEVYISFIRKKLKLIETSIRIKSIRNMGYKLEVVCEENEK